MRRMRAWVGSVLVGLSSLVNSAVVCGEQAAAVEADDPFGGAPPQRIATEEKSLFGESATKTKKPGEDARKTCACVGESGSAAVERIERALGGPLHSTGLEFTETPLSDITAALQEQYGVPIQIDRPALEELGVSMDEQVTVNLRGISLRAALRLMLNTVGLTYIIQDEVLMVTTPQRAEERLKVCVYDVSDIAGKHDEQTEAIIGAIESCVASDTWGKNGGGEAQIRPIKPGLLVVSQTADVHQEIRDLLATIRRMTPVRETSPSSTLPAAPK